MSTKLYKYQEDIVNSQNKCSSALFMDMGTGKTITSLNIFNKHCTDKILIICLISKMKDWKEDLLKECDRESIILDKGTNKNRELLKNSNSVIINFESCWRLEELLKWVDKKTTILIDESHKIKNPTSKIGKFCDKLSKLTDYKIILTGTPQSQGYIDYYNQLKFIGLIDCKFKDFKNNFCVFEKVMFNGFPVEKLVGYKNIETLDTIIKNNCVFYERKIEDEMIPTNIISYFNKPKVYDKFKKERIYKETVADTNGKLFVTLRTICSGSIENNEVDNQKIQWLKDMFDCTEDRIVIFYNFNIERDRIISLLKKENILYNEYNGREKSFSNFKKYKKSVILCQYKSASTGLNDLCISNKCVFYSLPLEYIDFSQAKKRIDRIGQTRKPLFYYLICRNTIEEQIWKSLQEGKDFDEKMFNEYINATY